jgi:peroxiredoxin
MSKGKGYLLILLIFLMASGCSPGKDLAIAQGRDLAPEFNLNDLGGNPVSLSDYRGVKPVILIFWTTWCPYCRAALKSLKDSYRSYKDTGIEILSINTGESTQKVRSFVEGLDLGFKSLLDRDAHVAYGYNVLGVPTYFFISKEGKIIFKGNTLPEARLKELLSEAGIDP